MKHSSVAMAEWFLWSCGASFGLSFLGNVITQPSDPYRTPRLCTNAQPAMMRYHQVHSSIHCFNDSLTSCSPRSQHGVEESCTPVMLEGCPRQAQDCLDTVSDAVFLRLALTFSSRGRIQTRIPSFRCPSRCSRPFLPWSSFQQTSRENAAIEAR